jgi:hypothetical protein
MSVVLWGCSVGYVVAGAVGARYSCHTSSLALTMVGLLIVLLVKSLCWSREVRVSVSVYHMFSY